jgi:hypothetical protein
MYQPVSNPTKDAKVSVECQESFMAKYLCIVFYIRLGPWPYIFASKKSKKALGWLPCSSTTA